MKGLAIVESKGKSERIIFDFFLKTINNIHMKYRSYHRKRYTMGKNCKLEQKISKRLKET